MYGKNHKSAKSSAAVTLPGRAVPVAVAPQHLVTRNPMSGPFPADLDSALFGMGCFWGAERLFWPLPGVYTTAVGYAGGYTPNPTHDEVGSGMTGHNEVVQVIFDAKVISFNDLLRLFWESHNPTQGMQQGADRGSQYRSGIYTNSDDQRTLACASRNAYQSALSAQGFAPITTEILPASIFYYAEDCHQQYLHKNPNVYCKLQGTGTRCIINPDELPALVTCEVLV